MLIGVRVCTERARAAPRGNEGWPCAAQSAMDLWCGQLRWCRDTSSGSSSRRKGRRRGGSLRPRRRLLASLLATRSLDSCGLEDGCRLVLVLAGTVDGAVALAGRKLNGRTRREKDRVGVSYGPVGEGSMEESRDLPTVEIW
jgi:hypothetical protein